MNYSLTVKLAAEADILKAYSWYEEKHVGLGKLFLESVDAVFESIQERPKMYQEVVTEIRRGVTRTFPYCVFTRLRERMLSCLRL